jgi:SNF2 family DNA or RNA helicase
VILQRDQLHAYQERFVAFILRVACCAGWIDLGLGKTVSALTAFNDLREKFLAHRCLVVGPLRVVTSTWPDEIAKWAHLRHLTYSVVCGTEEERLTALRKPADIYLINFDNLPWLEKQIGMHKMPFDIAIIDESSAFKNRDGIRFKVMRRMARLATRVIELTATPAPNSYLELWPQFYLVDGGARLFDNITEYRNRYFSYVGAYGEGKWVIKKGAKEVIQDRIRDITMTMLSKDYLKMPPILPPNDIVIELNKADRKRYDDAEKSSILKLTDGVQVRAPNAVALAIKLMQLANGVVYDTDKVQHDIHTQKIEALKEIHDSALGEPLLVTYQFKSDKDRILRAFPSAVLLDNDPETIRRWNRGEIDILLMHPKSGGHGLNLQFGGNVIVWYSLGWSLELYLQLIGRLRRQGQTRPVSVYRLIVRNTVDEILRDVLAYKGSQLESLLEAMKVTVDDEEIPMPTKEVLAAELTRHLMKRLTAESKADTVCT